MKKPGKFIFSLISFLCAVSILTDIALAREIPSLRGRVNDYAGIISPPAERMLTLELNELENTDSTQIAVLTIPSLEGDILEEFSIRVAEKWKIGRKGKDNGALLIIARDEKKVRIETGYGLEGNLTDLAAGRIIDNIIIPNFKKGDYNQGITSGVRAMIETVRGEYRGTAKSAPIKHDKKSGYMMPLLFLIFIISMIGSGSRLLGGLTGAVLFPIVGLFLFPLSFLLLLLIPIGFIAGLALPGIFFFIGPGGFFGGGGGGFSSGGFSGGGGGFGGGGASGDW